MKRNVGGADRTIRILLGLAILAAGVYYQTWWGAIGLVPLVTALVGWCPAYVPFGIRTCRVEGRGGAGSPAAG